MVLLHEKYYKDVLKLCSWLKGLVKYFIFRKHVYMKFVLKCVLGLDCWECDCMNIGFALGHFF